MRALLDECAEVVLRPFFRTLGYDVQLCSDGCSFKLVELSEGGAKMYGGSRDGQVIRSPHDDLKAQINAAEKLLDRVYGRPKVQAQVSGVAGRAVRVEHGIDLKLLTDDELAALEAIHVRLKASSLDWESAAIG